MSENESPRKDDPTAIELPADEGGLRAPPGLGFWRKVWWWFDFVVLVNLAQLTPSPSWC